MNTQDYTRSDSFYKLYEVPRASIVTPVFDKDLFINFSHIDGMYSFCTLLGTKDVVHLGASTDVYVWTKK